MPVSAAVKKHIDAYKSRISAFSEKLAGMYERCFLNTYKTSLKMQPDGMCFVLTGDIPAMWLRDSTAQVTHYVPLCRDDEEMRAIVTGVIRRQLSYICMDPYANAFNESANGAGHTEDLPKNSPWVWEHKYEIDSLCYPLRLVSLYVRSTDDRSVVDGLFFKAFRTILDVWKTEQHHMELSPYRFYREGPAIDTLGKEGTGSPVAFTGMTWSGFRPSDDSCTYGYLIASELFAVRCLKDAADLLGRDEPVGREALLLADDISEGVQKYGIVEHPVYGRIYACEVDGLGHAVCLDDANVPSLLSLPYLGCVDAEDPVYVNTRRFILSRDNPYYYEGTFARGIGSPHTPENYIWHIALSMQGLTSKNGEEVRDLLRMLERTDAGTGFMHEGFFADDPSKFTRPWFCWSNSLFAEFLEYAADNGYLD